MKCEICKSELVNDEIALCRKLMGRNINQFYCLDCIAKKYNVTTERLREKIEEFRESGCLLFLNNQDSNGALK